MVEKTRFLLTWEPGNLPLILTQDPRLARCEKRV